MEDQLRTVKLMIKVAQARRKAVKVEVLPCILSTSLNADGSTSPSQSVGSRARRLPKLECAVEAEEVAKSPESVPEVSKQPSKKSTEPATQSGASSKERDLSLESSVLEEELAAEEVKCFGCTASSW